MKSFQPESLSLLIHSVASWACLVARTLFLEKLEFLIETVESDRTATITIATKPTATTTSNRDWPEISFGFIWKLENCCVFVVENWNFVTVYLLLFLFLSA
jgi:hypothetical protein